MFEAIVVGLGKQGAKHCEAISKIGGRVTCAVDPKLGNKTGRIVAEFDFPVFEKLDDVLESDWSCDVAVICTPVLARKNALLGLISAGVKRFVIEKPLAVSLEEAAWYTQQEQKHGVKIYVNYTYRMSPPFF